MNDMGQQPSVLLAEAAAIVAMDLNDAFDGWSNPLVRKLESFTILSDGDRTVLEGISGHPRTVAARTDLIREGDKPKSLFLILEGMACRHKVRVTGARQIMAYLLPGDLCDLDVTLLNAMDHTITTLSACKVVYIAPETISDLTAHYPQIARALRMSTLVDEATLREWLMGVGCRSGVERIAHLFCELMVRMQAVRLVSEDGFAFPLTQAILAETIGLSSVHLNRMLQELRRERLITLRRGRLTILDMPRLKALAEFKANYLHLGERAAA